MAGMNFVNGQFCVARVNSQSFLQCLEKREDLGGGQLEAGLLSAEDVGGLAGLGPGCVVVGHPLASKGFGVAMLASW